jgi:hypothetical protein
MFTLSPDERLTAWSKHRQDLDTSKSPLTDLIEFWNQSPYVPYNRQVDPYHQRSWPTPWEIIVENKYDDFTKALMMSWTLKLTTRFKDSKIEIKTYVDTEGKRQYNLVLVDEENVINYDDNGLVNAEDIPDSFRLENLVEVTRPR